ncbi:piggyBac transposable element-derived protein 5-like [Trachinotus anak]|uniref:piggyBac transposable element-derived protein 5-like n=1 Tax=Trachinotus anak TaxID=443729 RepID=UPI0039F1C2A9
MRIQSGANRQDHNKDGTMEENHGYREISVKEEDQEPRRTGDQDQDQEPHRTGVKEDQEPRRTGVKEDQDQEPHRTGVKEDQERGPTDQEPRTDVVKKEEDQDPYFICQETTVKEEERDRDGDRDRDRDGDGDSPGPPQKRRWRATHLNTDSQTSNSEARTEPSSPSESAAKTRSHSDDTPSSDAGELNRCESNRGLDQFSDCTQRRQRSTAAVTCARPATARPRAARAGQGRGKKRGRPPKSARSHTKNHKRRDDTKQRRRRSHVSVMIPGVSKSPKTTVDADVTLLPSSDDSEDSEYDSETEIMFTSGMDKILDQSVGEVYDSDWEPEIPGTPPHKRNKQRWQTSTCSVEQSAPTRTKSAAPNCSAPVRSGAPGSAKKGRSPRQSAHVLDQPWRTVDDEDVEPTQLVFMPTREPGPQEAARLANSPLDFFKLFFTDAVLATLLTNSNAYGAKKQEGHKTAWRNIAINDLYSFIAMVIYMGLVKCSAMVDYWKGSRLYNFPFPASVISRNKFLNICRTLHISDVKDDAENETKRGTPEYDRLGKIKPLYNHIVETCKTHFQPGQHISIDERMVASKAKISIKQHVQNKPARWGYKLFVLADSSCGYTWNFHVYEGKSSASGNGLSYDSVMSLIHFDKLGTGYHLYVDNFYTSTHLFQDLLTKKIGACGTIHQNRAGFPKSQTNDFTRDTPRGTMRWIRDGDLLFVKWKDTREVAMCSTIHKAYNGDTVGRRMKAAGKWMQTDVPIPAPIKEYNQHMGGVDLSDALIGYYSVLHKTRKWYRTFFYHFVDIAVVNAFILYTQCGRSPAMTQKEFRQALVEELANQGSESTSHPSSLRYMARPDPKASHKLRYFSDGKQIPKRDASTVFHVKWPCVLWQRGTASTPGTRREDCEQRPCGTSVYDLKSLWRGTIQL